MLKWATEGGRTVLHKFGSFLSLKSVTTTERLRSRARLAAYLGRPLARFSFEDHEFALYYSSDEKSLTPDVTILVVPLYHTNGDIAIALNAVNR